MTFSGALPPEPPLDQPLYGAAFDEAFVRYWRKGLTFTGRASRSEYWIMWLLGFIASLVAYAVAYAVGYSGDRTATGLVVLGALMVSLATIVPGIALSVRRLHDANLSGWWLLLGLVPFGGLALLIMLAMAPNLLGARFDKRSAVGPTPLASPLAPTAPALRPLSAASGESSPIGGASAATASQHSSDDGREGRLVLAVLGGVAVLILLVTVISMVQQSKAGQAAAVTTAPVQQTQRPVQQAAPAPRPVVPSTDAREAALRSEVEAAPGWQKYSSSLYFKWENGGGGGDALNCPVGSNCVTVLVEKVTARACGGGTVEMTLLSNGVPVGSSSGNIIWLDQGVPARVGVPFSPTLKGDHVRVDRITCG